MVFEMTPSHKTEAEYKIEMDQIIYGSGFGRIVDGKIEHIPIEEVVMTEAPKNEAEKIEEAAFENSKQYLHSKIIAMEAFKEGIAWRDENLMEVDDHEQFKKDLDEHHRTWGSAHDRHFTDGWKKCRNYKFKLNLKSGDANPLPHPDTVRLEWMIEGQKCVWRDQDYTHEYAYEKRNGKIIRFKLLREAIDAAMKEEEKI